MSEDSAVKVILAARPSLEYQMAFEHLQTWFAEDQQISAWPQDKIVVQWLEQFNQSSSMHDRIMNLHKQSARENIRR